MISVKCHKIKTVSLLPIKSVFWGRTITVISRILMKAMIVKYTYKYIISYYYMLYTYKNVNQIRCLIHEKKRHVMNECRGYNKVANGKRVCRTQH